MEHPLFRKPGVIPMSKVVDDTGNFNLLMFLRKKKIGAPNDHFEFTFDGFKEFFMKSSKKEIFDALPWELFEMGGAGQPSNLD